MQRYDALQGAINLGCVRVRRGRDPHKDVPDAGRRLVSWEMNTGHGVAGRLWSRSRQQPSLYTTSHAAACHPPAPAPKQRVSLGLMSGLNGGCSSCIMTPRAIQARSWWSNATPAIPQHSALHDQIDTRNTSRARWLGMAGPLHAISVVQPSKVSFPALTCVQSFGGGSTGGQGPARLLQVWFLHT